MSAKLKMSTTANEAGGSYAFAATLSRKIKSCDNCRRSKIRCNLPPDGNPPCTRCNKTGMECKITKSLQSILDDRQIDSQWKASVEKRLDAIVSALEAGSSQRAMQNLHLVMSEVGHVSNHVLAESSQGPSRVSKRKRDKSVASDSPDKNLGLLADAASVGDNATIKEQWADEELADLASAPGEHLRQLAVPASSTSQSSLRVDRSRQADIIDQGLITLNQACTFIDLYLEKLDSHVYSIVARQHCPLNERHSTTRLRESVSSIRKSPLLLLAVCTVASLHCNQAIANDGTIGKSSPSSIRLYSSLYNEFIRVSAQRSFVRHQSMDDVRALLVASWWLRDLSWILTASAVRLATERGMQDAYKKCSDIKAGKSWMTTRSDQTCSAGCAISMLIDDNVTTIYSEEERIAYEEAKLYYLVYVADHQAAIPFGRPPMTRQHAAVRNAAAWLAGCRLTNVEDERLVSQVELWVIAHDVVDDFGVDVQQRLRRLQVLEQVPRFTALIDRWSKRWSQEKHPSRQMSNHAEVQHEADMLRLFIDAHAFRAPPGISPLLIQDEENEVISLDISDRVDHRESFAYQTMPSIPLQSTDERQSRILMGARAVSSAHSILAYYQQSPARIYGQPIYPQVMLIFACLFLNKLSKTYGQDRSLLLGNSVERLTLPNCERRQVMDSIENIVSILRQQAVKKCNSSQLCASAVPGLSSIISESKREQHSSASSSNSWQNEDPSALTAPLTSPLPFNSSSSFTFDLQTLDLLSNTRFLSGVNNDASLWYGQDDWVTNDQEANQSWL